MTDLTNEEITAYVRQAFSALRTAESFRLSQAVNALTGYQAAEAAKEKQQKGSGRQRWQDFKDPVNGAWRHYEYSPDGWRQFCEQILETLPEVIQGLLHNSGTPFVIRKDPSKPGVDPKKAQSVIDAEMAISPLLTPATPSRSYSTRSRILDRLAAEAATDPIAMNVYRRVRAGVMTPLAASVEMGWRRPTVSVRADLPGYVTAGIRLFGREVLLEAVMSAPEVSRLYEETECPHCGERYFPTTSRSASCGRRACVLAAHREQHRKRMERMSPEEREAHNAKRRERDARATPEQRDVRNAKQREYRRRKKEARDAS